MNTNAAKSIHKHVSSELIVEHPCVTGPARIISFLIASQYGRGQKHVSCNIVLLNR